MERPVKRIRISDPEVRSPRDSTSPMAKGLFTSELGIQTDSTEHRRAVPTRTINLSEFQRRAFVGERPSLPRRNAGIYLLPRAPDATVTASVVEINVNDGTATSAATIIPVATGETVVSLSDMGSVTVPGVSSVSGVVGSVLTDSQSIITTPPPSPLPSGTSLSSTSIELSPAGSVLSEALNSTLADISSTTEHTVTVTATSTFEISFINGTIIATTETLTASTRSGHGSSSGTSHGASTSIQPESSGIGGTDSGSVPASTTTFLGVGGTAYPGSSTTSLGATASSSETGSSGGGGGGGPGLTPVQQQVVGGVVGGVAGVAIILLVLLVVLRWYRRRLKVRGELPEQIAARSLGGAPDSSMSQRSSAVPLTSQLRSSLRKWRPISAHTHVTNATAPTTPEAERGFQRIAGRKIAPVLSSGGDGFGGNYGAFEKQASAGPSHARNERSMAGSSFYRDSGGFYGGRGTESPTLPPSPTTAASGAESGHASGPTIGRDFAKSPDSEPNPSQVSLPSSRPEGIAALRPSPARTPVTVSPAASSIRLPIQQPPTVGDDAPPVPQIVVPMMHDGVGRTLLREDGSRVSARSRSTGTASRFAENIL